MERTTHPDRHPALRLPRPMDSRSAQGTCSLVSRSKYFFGTLIYMRMDTARTKTLAQVIRYAAGVGIPQKRNKISDHEWV